MGAKILELQMKNPGITRLPKVTTGIGSSGIEGLLKVPIRCSSRTKVFATNQMKKISKLYQINFRNHKIQTGQFSVYHESPPNKIHSKSLKIHQKFQTLSKNKKRKNLVELHKFQVLMRELFSRTKSIKKIQRKTHPTRWKTKITIQQEEKREEMQMKMIQLDLF